MKWYYCNDANRGLWPVGFCAMVWASSPGEAASLLNRELLERKYTNEQANVTPDEMHVLEPPKLSGDPTVQILVTGDY